MEKGITNDKLNLCGTPDLLTPVIIDRVADLVIEKLTTKMEGAPPLHGGGQGFESPHLNQGCYSPRGGRTLEAPPEEHTGTALR